MKKAFLSGVVAIVSSFILSIGAFAAPPPDLDTIGTQPPATSASQQVQTPASGNTQAGGSSSATNNGFIDYSKLGPGADDMAAATELVAPVVKWVNIGIGILTAILGTILLASTALDLVYIVSPTFVRNLGSNNAAAQQNMMGGMSGPAPAATGFASLISDDCRAALDECGAPGGMSPAPAGGMGGMGMGMGGMGMGGMGAPAAAPASKKAVALCYLKKRVFTFVLIGICAVLLTCTLFLDVGTKVGMWIYQMVSGI